MDFFKKIKPFDIIVILLLLIAFIVFGLTHFHKRETSSKQIEAHTKVDIQVYFRGVVVTSENSPFKEGEYSFITIRNVPYTKLKIKTVNFERKKTMLPMADGSYQIVNDLTVPYSFDFLVTLEDDAKITKDGAVIGGNKIKIGLPITLEGFDYRLNGVVSNITISNKKISEFDSSLNIEAGWN